MRSLAAVVLAGTAVLGAACTVHNTDVPPVSGPSEAALSLVLTASPDTITQDGASQSSITIFARDANAKPVSGLSLRFDMSVGGTVFDFGTLSARTVVTGSDGRAHVVYTAPPPPPPATAGSGTRVTIVATAIGTNFQASSSQLVDIRLVPPGVILPPADTPTAAFTVSGTPADAGTTVFFDGSGSCGGPITAGVCSSANVVRSWTWNFGDGSAGASGVSASHKFANAADFIVTLTVTNDRGVTASVSQSVTIGSPTLPTAKFVFSPSSPAIGAGTNTVLFNADQSTAAPGHQITQFNWNFGDPSSASNTASGFTVTHVFNTPGAFTVVLSILDDLGQKATFSQTVNVVP